jgi:hypothetical protein
MTDPSVPPRAAPKFKSREDLDEDIWDYSFKGDSGKIIRGMGTIEQMEMYRASRCRQM